MCKRCIDIIIGDYKYIYHTSTYNNSKHFSTHTYSYYHFITANNTLSFVPSKNDGYFRCVCGSYLSLYPLRYKHPTKLILILYQNNIPKDVVNIILRLYHII